MTSRHWLVGLLIAAVFAAPATTPGSGLRPEERWRYGAGRRSRISGRFRTP